MSVRCKFKLVEKTECSGGGWRLRFTAVYNGSSENDKFFKATPSGSLEFTWITKDGAEQFIVDKEYYIDISPTE